MDRHYEERMQEKLNELKNSLHPEPIRSDGAGARIRGPRNVDKDRLNPDILVPYRSWLNSKSKILYV